jgi:hypothetical protein
MAGLGDLFITIALEGSYQVKRYLFLSLLICGLAFGQNPNTAAFPGAVSTDQDLGVAKDGAQSTLAASINSSQTTFTLTTSSAFRQYSFITIASEIMQVCSISGTSVTVCSRGASGTTAASHAAASPVRNNIVAHYHNQLAAEVKAIENLLGPNGVNFTPIGGSPHAVTFNISGGGSTIATGNVGLYPSSGAYSGTINRVDISGYGTSGATCSITVNIWKRNAAIPTSGQKISASAPAALSSSNLAQGGSLSGWTTSVAANDAWGASVASVTGCISAVVQVYFQ